MPSSDFQPLSNVPNELWLEIISHYRYSFDFNCPLIRQEDFTERMPLRQTLRSLSQASSTLRVLTLPFLWERFDITAPVVQPLNEFECLPLIRSVHVWWRSRSPTKVETLALVKFLKTLPNLSGLQTEVYDTTQKFTRILGSASLPNITNLLMPDSLHGIFPAFPNLTTLACPSMFVNSLALGPAKKHFPRLEALIGLRFINNDDHETLVEDFPHLRVLAVANILQSNMRTLPLGELITGGKDVLRASHAGGSKLLRVWEDDAAGPRLIHFERC
ncbi:hypothetical protein C8F04DRAFT_1202225 [Mycena alexandri]|uniref:Uncharacterized protein n=1 Tax=Mycena alexandri TaxID=1745969 RepID=A0AAD6RXN8_9AGAR|nr:hypothetical protein C8F04DRAFT_1202225 [Mycena alexandri]